MVRSSMWRSRWRSPTSSTWTRSWRSRKCAPPSRGAAEWWRPTHHASSTAATVMAFVAASALNGAKFILLSESAACRRRRLAALLAPPNNMLGSLRKTPCQGLSFLCNVANPPQPLEPPDAAMLPSAVASPVPLDSRPPCEARLHVRIQHRALRRFPVHITPLWLCPACFALRRPDRARGRSCQAVAVDVEEPTEAERLAEAFAQQLGAAERGSADSAGVQRAKEEALEDAAQLQQLLWRKAHPERAKEYAEAAASGEKRLFEFEDQGTVNALLNAFVRDVRVKAQSIDREVPPGVESKVVHLLRHGQGFHNMLEGFEGMEGSVSPETTQVEVVDGKRWFICESFDKLFKSEHGPRTVVGLQLYGAISCRIATSRDYGATWATVPQATIAASGTTRRIMFQKPVACTHVGVQPDRQVDSLEFDLLVPALARHELLDPSLTALGRGEALAANRDAVQQQLSPRLIVVSPITRATQTAFLAFRHLLMDNGLPKRGVRFVAHEGLHERGGGSTCDCRRPRRELQNEFPHVDYRLLKQQDPLWSAQRESQASMVARLHRFFKWLRTCPEEEVALVAHCSINFTMLNAVVDCSLDPHLADWFVTAELRSMRVLWEEPRKETAKFIDGGHLVGLAKGHCQLYPHLLRIAQEGDEDSVHLRRDYKEYAASGHVALICGGGAGHEPLMAGFVGQGLLTASVTGALFAAPSPGAIFRAIMAAAGPAGCILIVKNYPGLRFNHAVAAERARSKGVTVELVIVSDDVGSQQGESEASRCLAGAAVVIKVAGSLAEDGKDLDEVRAAAQSTADAIKTMALALRWRGVDWILELGVGIHGEAGVQEMSSLASLPGATDGRFATAVVRALLRQLLPAAKLPPGEGVVLVLNNLGGTSPLEMSVLCDAAFRQLQDLGAEVAGCVQGTLVTCLDMHGVSLSLIPLTDAPGQLLELLAAPAQVGSAWPGLLIPPKDSEAVVQNHLVPRPVAGETGAAAAQTRAVISAACQMLISDSTVKALDEMDFECGDADCGGTHRDAAEALLATLEAVPSEPADALRFLAQHLEHQCRGAIGGIYVLGLEAAAKRVGSTPTLLDWAEALAAAGKAIQEYGGAQQGDRTVLDAVLPAAEALRACAKSPNALAEAVKAAKQGAKKTQQMVAKKGRAVHVPPSRQARSPDPGAVGFAKWLEAVERALRD
eukprot:s1729_g4.t1